MARKICPDVVKSFSVRKMISRISKLAESATMLLDHPDQPAACLLLQGGMLATLGDHSSYPEMFADLLHGRVEPAGSWPPEHLLKSLEWQGRHEKYRSLFLNSVPVTAHQAALESGWLAPPDDEGSPPAYLYCFEGQPRFADLVRHDCRLGQGRELQPFIKRGISYDEEGFYTGMCLDNGPSFVCEVDGIPVCWSCTHLNGTMGMIYTPEEHRRKGYARSLAAFQIDYMLELEKFACCHVIEGNTASIEMVLSLGARKEADPICWRSVLWPEELVPQSSGIADSLG